MNRKLIVNFIFLRSGQTEVVAVDICIGQLDTAIGVPSEDVAIGGTRI